MLWVVCLFQVTKDMASTVASKGIARPFESICTLLFQPKVDLNCYLARACTQAKTLASALLFAQAALHSKLFALSQRLPFCEDGEGMIADCIVDWSPLG